MVEDETKLNPAESLVQVARMVAGYYVALVKEGMPEDIAENLTLAFQAQLFRMMGQSPSQKALPDGAL